LDPTLLSVIFIVFLGCFTQSLTGFGVALVTMALLPSLLGLQVATPLVSLIGLILEVLMLLRYHASIQFKTILGLVISSTVAIPIGVIYMRKLDQDVALFILGLVILVFSVYALIGFRLPELKHPAWAWSIGLVSGLLGGAYNTAGPPVIVYGNCRRWSPQEFKSNLSGFFIVGSTMVVATHWVSGNFTSTVRSNFIVCLPALLIGFLLGQGLDKWQNPDVFRRIVLVLLVFLGIRLMK